MPYDYEIVGVKNNREAKKYKFFGSPQISIDCKDIDSHAEKASQFHTEGCRVTIWQGKMVEYPPKKMLLSALLRERKGVKMTDKENGTVHICPMHPEVKGKKGDRCDICGMLLVPEDEVISTQHVHESEEVKSFLQTYQPLFIIIGLIFLPVLTLALRDLYTGNFVWQRSMSFFMAGFFLVFSGFKFLNLSGFAQGYSTYDLLARRWFAYGYIYPFIELTLGLAYLIGYNPPLTNLVTVGVMTFSGVGVVQSVAKKRNFKCVCLGTIIDVPLTNVTIIEDFGMASMALLMLL